MEHKNSKRVYKIIMLVVLTAFITFLITTIVMYNKFGSIGTGGTSNKESTNISAIFQEFKALLSEKYIGNLDEQNMIDGAIKGYVSGAGDEYTEYLTTEEMKELAEETSSKYVGIGVYVANNTDDNTILVVAVMKGSPALESGIQAGDIIEKIDDVAYSGKELTAATTILKGQENTDVKVTVIRDNKEIDMNVTRKTISVEHVASKTLDNNIGYIQIDSFDDGVADKFEEDLKTLQSSNIKGLIIDLRSNGGGVVDEATDIASMFSNDGDTVLITTDKNKDEQKTKTSKSKIINNIPVVVLVNEGTASASEILAGALRDNYGATIVGKNTYGKGVIQTVYKLSDGSGLKVTTNEYFTPNHIEINKKGIRPDIDVDLTKDSDGNYEVTEDKDAQLKKAIEFINSK